MRDGMRTTKTTSGFTLVELVVVVAITIILLGVTIPAVKSWVPDHQLKSAAMDVFTSLQRAKSEAIRANVNYAIVFDPANGTYKLQSNPGADGIFGNIDDPSPVEQITLANYASVITYGHYTASTPLSDGTGTFDDEVSYPAVGGTSDVNVAVFDSRGMCVAAGSVYLQNNNKTYAVGTLASGVVRVRRWDGSSWN